MLIRPCHRVIKAINYLCSVSKTTSSLDLMVYFNQKTKNLDLLNTIRQLSDDGFITINDHHEYIDGISLTYKGRHYSEYRWTAALEIIIKSFIIPVAVAFVTTIMTLIANGILF